MIPPIVQKKRHWNTDTAVWKCQIMWVLSEPPVKTSEIFELVKVTLVA